MRLALQVRLAAPMLSVPARLQTADSELDRCTPSLVVPEFAIRVVL